MAKFGTLVTIWVIGLAVGTSIIVAKTLPSEPSQPQHKMTTEEYKASARTISYEELARNPNVYRGATVKFEGKVVQAGYGFLRVDVEAHIAAIDRPGLGGSIVYVTYDHKPNESRILEGDKVRLWGQSNGIITYKAVLGHMIEIPSVAARIVEDDGKFIDPKPKSITFNPPKPNSPKR